MAEVEGPKFDLQNILIGAGVIFLIIAGYFYNRSKGNQGEVSNLPIEEVIVQEEGTVKKTGEVVQPLTDEELEQLKEEVDGVLLTGGETVELQDVAGLGAAGQAKRAFSDGKYYFKVTALGFGLAEKGYYYEAWLKKDDDYFSTGRLTVDVSGEGYLYYTASADKSEYSKAVVTLEPEDGNPEPASPILEGSF